MTVLGKFTAVTVGLALVSEVAHADVYMQSPPGSNNRNCRNDNNTNRRNGNRMFDSQNNDKGGYSCPQAYPFRCYDGQCNNNSEGTVTLNAVGAGGNGVRTAKNANSATAAAGGFLSNTPQQYVYADSILNFEFTAQHGLGDNPKVRSEAILQYACEDTMPQARDGLTVRNNGGNNKKDEATNTIPRNANAQDDAGFGRHETLDYYNACRTRARAQGLYTADQDLQGNSAIYSRQNPNGNRNGLECPEESEYYPYWGASPWKDVALIVSDPADCKKTEVSQNMMSRAECVGDFNKNNPAPLEAAACTAAGGTMTTIPAFDLPAPSCWVGPRSRSNHLGNAGGRAVLVSGDPSRVTIGGEMGESMSVNVTVPADMAGKGNCVWRLRYNTSTTDTVTGRDATTGVFTEFTSANNDDTLVADRQEREVLSYKKLDGIGLTDAKFEVGTAVNTNQYGRTFQDRTHSFVVKAAPATGRAIFNLNVRGKRGNIVQAYPSVEYDFAPSQLEVTPGDQLHIALPGSDYNPDRNPNNGEGGPSNPNNDNEAKSDRTNFVPMAGERSSYMASSVRGAGGAGLPKALAEDVKMYQRLAMTSQMDAGVECESIEQLRQRIGGNNANKRERRERYHTNCGKLSAQIYPVFDAGLMAAGTPGSYQFLNSRNNNLSNRDQKMAIQVQAGAQTPVGALPARFGVSAQGNGGGFDGSGDDESSGEMLAIAGGAAGALAAVGVAFAAFKSTRSSGGSSRNSRIADGDMAPQTGGGGGSGKMVSARYAHNAKEAGELSFGKGDKITVLRQDASGWWEGKLASGASGIFPSNYVQ